LLLSPLNMYSQHEDHKAENKARPEIEVKAFGLKAFGHKDFSLGLESRLDYGNLRIDLSGKGMVNPNAEGKEYTNNPFEYTTFTIASGRNLESPIDGFSLYLRINEQNEMEIDNHHVEKHSVQQIIPGLELRLLEGESIDLSLNAGFNINNPSLIPGLKMTIKPHQKVHIYMMTDIGRYPEGNENEGEIMPINFETGVKYVQHIKNMFVEAGFAVEQMPVLLKDAHENYFIGFQLAIGYTNKHHQDH